MPASSLLTRPLQNSSAASLCLDGNIGAGAPHLEALLAVPAPAQGRKRGEGGGEGRKRGEDEGGGRGGRKRGEGGGEGGGERNREERELCRGRGRGRPYQPRR
jgi:hypothetical protein